MMALFVGSFMLVSGVNLTNIINKKNGSRAWAKVLEIALIGAVCGKVNSTYKIYVLFTLIMASVATSI